MTTIVKPTLWRTVVRPANASAAMYRDLYDTYPFGDVVIGLHWAEAIFDEVNFAEGPDTVDIARVSTDQLGFVDDAAIDINALYERAFSPEFGLVKIPAWVPVQLQYEYKEQPEDEHLIAGMEPMLTKHLSLLFMVVRYSTNGGHGQRQLETDDSRFLWYSRRPWLFGLPRK